MSLRFAPNGCLDPGCTLQLVRLQEWPQHHAGSLATGNGEAPCQQSNHITTNHEQVSSVESDYIIGNIECFDISHPCIQHAVRNMHTEPSDRLQDFPPLR